MILDSLKGFVIKLGVSPCNPPSRRGAVLARGSLAGLAIKHRQFSFLFYLFTFQDALVYSSFKHALLTFCD